MTALDPRDEWVHRALAAADEQLGHIDVEDDQVLDVVAEVMLRVERQPDEAA